MKRETNYQVSKEKVTFHRTNSIQAIYEYNAYQNQSTTPRILMYK